MSSNVIPLSYVCYEYGIFWGAEEVEILIGLYVFERVIIAWILMSANEISCVPMSYFPTWLYPMRMNMQSISFECFAFVYTCNELFT